MKRGRDEKALHPTDGAAARLREDIDRGLTGDKVNSPDPAAAPLGTDEEAAGMRIPVDAVERARTMETFRHAATHDRRRASTVWILIGIIVFIGVAGLFALTLI